MAADVSGVSVGELQRERFDGVVSESASARRILCITSDIAQASGVVESAADC